VSDLKAIRERAARFPSTEFNQTDNTATNAVLDRAALLAIVDELAEALRAREHNRMCGAVLSKHGGGKHPCDCGLNAALAKLEKDND
jgi:hypothetical protein